MQSKDKNRTNLDRASGRLPAFIVGGLLAGLLVGVLVGNIPYGAAGGALVALLAWFAVAGKRTVQQAPDADADA